MKRSFLMPTFCRHSFHSKWNMATFRKYKDWGVIAPYVTIVWLKVDQVGGTCGAPYSLYKLWVVIPGKQHSWLSGFLSFKGAVIGCFQKYSYISHSIALLYHQLALRATLWKEEFLLLLRIWVRWKEDKPSSLARRMVAKLVLHWCRLKKDFPAGNHGPKSNTY